MTRRIAGVLRKVLDRATEVALFISMILLALLVITYLFEVVSRYFFNAPKQWPSNLEPALFCAGVFLALPAVTRSHEHISIDLIPSQLPRRMQRRLNIALMYIAAFVCAVMTYVTGTEVANQIAKGVSTFGSLPYPKWWVSVFIPIGFSMTALQFLFLALDMQEKSSE
jgi:C4-dicarboxylate transporter DctQ subunit